MIPNPLKDWYKDKKKQDKLAALLSDPVMKEAMDLLKDTALTMIDTSARPASDAITQSAFDLHRMGGFHQYPQELWSLTELPSVPKGKPDGYSQHYVAAHMRRTGLWQDFDFNNITEPEPN